MTQNEAIRIARREVTEIRPCGKHGWTFDALAPDNGAWYAIPCCSRSHAVSTRSQALINAACRALGIHAPEYEGGSWKDYVRPKEGQGNYSPESKRSLGKITNPIVLALVEFHIGQSFTVSCAPDRKSQANMRSIVHTYAAPAASKRTGMDVKFSTSYDAKNQKMTITRIA